MNKHGDRSRSYIWVIRNAQKNRYAIALEQQSKYTHAEPKPAKDSFRTLAILRTRARRLKNA